MFTIGYSANFQLTDAVFLCMLKNETFLYKRRISNDEKREVGILRDQPKTKSVQTD